MPSEDADTVGSSYMQRYNPTIRARSLIIKDNYVLLCRLSSRPIAFRPGGRVEPGENIERAAVREIQEETGATPLTLDYLGVVEHLWSENGIPMHDLNHYFAADCPNLNTNQIPTCIKRIRFL